MKKVIFFLQIFLVPILAFSQTIVDLHLPKNAFKIGEEFEVLLKTSEKFNTNNIFSIQISDHLGNFSNPIEIGRVASQSDTVIKCRILGNLQVGKDYQIRATASNPSFVSNPYPARIILYLGSAFFVDTDGNDTNEGSSNKPFQTIQKAIDKAWFYDTIYVRPGTYFENLVFRGIDVTLIGIAGPQKTIIDGQKNGNPVITLENGESHATIIDGFTIQNGVNYQMDNGPGITIKYQNTSPILRNLIIQNNEAWAFGGAIYCYNAGRVKVINCRIENNKAKYFGSGIYTDMTNIDVEKCIIRNNASGGIYNWRSYSNIINSLIYWNNSDEVTIFSDLGIQMTPKIINSTIVSKGQYYGLFLYGRFLAEVWNSIFYGNDSTIAVIGDAYDTLKMSYSIIFNYPNKFRRDKVSLVVGKNFYSDDPMFIDPKNENFSPDSCSPALGTALKFIAPSVDVFGFPRPIDTFLEEDPDMGAIESPKTQRSSIVKISRVSNTKFCKSGTFTIDFTVSGCPFFGDNEFIAELSNVNGTFNPSYEIGKMKSTSSGTINCTIPRGIPSGDNYKVRIRATHLPYRSQPYSENFAIYDIPKVTIFGSKQVCSNREYEYWTDSSEYPTNKWIIKNGYSRNNLTENKIKVIWFDSSNGTIKLIQKNLAGCIDSAFLNVSIIPTPPKPSIRRLSDGQLVSSYPSWNQWYWNGMPIQGATGMVHKPTRDGYYSVKIVPPSGCESDFSDSVYVVISTVEIEDEDDFKVIQENKLIKIKLSQNKTNILYICVVDFIGNEIFCEEVDVKNNELQVSMNSLAKGIYFLKIYSEYGVKFYKLVLVN